MDGDCVAGVVPVPAGVQPGVGRGGVGHVQAAPDEARGSIALHAEAGDETRFAHHTFIIHSHSVKNSYNNLQLI